MSHVHAGEQPLPLGSSDRRGARVLGDGMNVVCTAPPRVLEGEEARPHELNETKQACMLLWLPHMRNVALLVVVASGITMLGCGVGMIEPNRATPQGTDGPALIDPGRSDAGVLRDGGNTPTPDGSGFLPADASPASHQDGASQPQRDSAPTQQDAAVQRDASPQRDATPQQDSDTCADINECDYKDQTVCMDTTRYRICTTGEDGCLRLDCSS
jgi:hypothetical protein